ncbi:NUDIX domain-containing protein [Streptomyces iconiensis]|uniref:NUDIX domain-containing protein n=1 Tax=Streptomyces iconiensis TaxID=1384038 RepID=A0ABT7A9P8_9ACTN|nr:NUDIX domain-containing protein [Streptomyces iconiensis]MDJ1137323.1 NUDIX domain-containing protein [Streptomyces iconiensis]
MPELVDYVDAADRHVRTGPRGGAHTEGLLYRVAATLLTDPYGRVLVYRRPEDSSVLPGHHDVLVGGSVRAGETPAQAAARELAEEFGPGAAECGQRAEDGGRPHVMWRERVEGPAGPCWLTVHHARVTEDALRPDPEEIAWHGFLPPEQLLDGAHPRPFNRVGLRALRRLADAPQNPLARQVNALTTWDGHKRHT